MLYVQQYFGKGSGALVVEISYGIVCRRFFSDISLLYLSYLVQVVSLDICLHLTYNMYVYVQISDSYSLMIKWFWSRMLYTPSLS